jgi:DNA polymerase III delta' subunit
MAGFLTRGQPAAIRQVTAMIAAGLPHALLLVGPRSVGKTTLAMDIAAAELCLAVDPADRPCRVCRGCRLVGSGNHPDVHRIAPDGPGGQIRIDRVRQLVTDLALLPVEGGARIAVLEAAHRLNDDAQNALLKLLEEPPTAVTIVLCADDEARLLQTIQSRVARIRLGTVAPREIESLIVERGDADAPTANRVARLAGGRPGLAIAYARAPEAATIRGELARSLVDLAAMSRASRLLRIRELLGRAKDLRVALAATEAPAMGEAVRSPRRGRAGAGRAAGAAMGLAGGGADGSAAEPGPNSETEPSVAEGTGGRATAVERRRDAALLLDLWRDLALDLAVVGFGDSGPVHDPDLLEELTTLAATLPAGSIGAFLVRLDEGGRALESNVGPELVADVLSLAWPRPVRAA